MIKKIYLILLKDCGNASPQVSLDKEQAYEIARQILAANPQLKTEQVSIVEYTFSKENKIIAEKEEELDK